ncbi:MAG: alpha/beta hydrolase [Gemmatimonadetes bacterium]|jgi:predicted alpha/beta superfamily hydrolase|nr:alpha/beta hydrolase [Gemmatimonadota bacterium]MBK8649411.1 alpha/beta hydrolase [Gemmatimonadota bacterium]
MFVSTQYLRKWSSRRRTPPGSLEVIPDVYSPELNNRRDISVYLPRSYRRTEHPYPVIYMHDGQNLFDPATSFAGEWGVDQAMARAGHRGRRAIVVAIPNMGVDRLREYSPFVDARAGGGGGDAYVDFILRTVKPMIDAQYRTYAGREGTGIVGSSMGGLISLYAFFRHPHAFGFAGIMSPALWFAERAIFPYVRSAPHVGGRLYLDVGTREGHGTLMNAREMRDILTEKGYAMGDKLSWVEDEAGLHNEESWGRRIRHALPFMLHDASHAAGHPQHGHDEHDHWPEEHEGAA